jgi:glycosyltransferase involved in cell wall biosynthesis
MRVIHVTNSMEKVISGPDRHILYLAAAQMARGMSVSVVLDRPGPMIDACQKRGIPVVMAEGLKLRTGMQPDGKTVQGLIEQFTRLNAELINCHGMIAAVQTIPAANRIQIPCVLTIHAGGDFPVQGNPFLQARRMGLRFAIISVSKPRFDTLKKLGIPETDLYYVPHGTDAVSPRHPRAVRQSNRPNLIFVGALSELKGADIAILVMSELRRRRAEGYPVLNMYGQGNAEQYLREMVTAIDLKGTVLFQGYVHDILASSDSADILIVPSREEQGPLVVLEAMSRGMPVVTSDVGDVRAMLPDRRYGRIVPVGSIIGFADAVESLLADIADGQIDPDLLKQRHQELYTTEKMAERIEAVYKSVLSNTHTGEHRRAARADRISATD